jgi:hypothetical protein
MYDSVTNENQLPTLEAAYSRKTAWRRAARQAVRALRAASPVLLNGARAARRRAPRLRGLLRVLRGA